MVGTALVVFLIGIHFVPIPAPQVVQVIDKNGNTTTQPLGALAGPDIQSPYLGWGTGQVNTYKAGQNFALATSTMCVIQIPPTSTSTIRYIAVIPSSSTTTAREIYIATSTQPFAPPLGAATSSMLAYATIAANAQDPIYWTPPASAVSQSLLSGAGASQIASSTGLLAFVANPLVGGLLSTTSATYVIVGLKGGGAVDSGVGAVPTGSCLANFDNFPQ